MATCLLMYLVADVPLRTAISIVGAVTGFIFVVFTGASLSWDMVCLLVKTFEFWFLFVANAFTGFLWCVLFGDIRRITFISIGAVFSMALFIDANIYSRRLLLQILVFGSPGILVGLTFTVLHLAPDLHFETFRVFNFTVDLVDVLMTGNFTIAYFTAGRVFRSRRIIFSQGPICLIVCDVILPVCQLVPFTPQMAVKNQQSNRGGGIQELKLVEDPSFRGIDLSRPLIPTVIQLIAKPHSSLNWAGYFSVVSCFVVMARHTSELVTQSSSSATLQLELVSLLAACLFIFIHAAHYQKSLVRLVFVELDSWYVSFQINVVAFGVLDLVDWNRRHIPFMFTVWIWCYWAILTDALPPTTRRKLHFSHRLSVLVNTMLLVYPMYVGYWMYFSTARPSLHNRVLLNVAYDDMAIRVDMLGVLASKLFTVWVWMGRSLWRELQRPHDAFKFIKRRLFYTVGGE